MLSDKGREGMREYLCYIIQTASFISDMFVLLKMSEFMIVQQQMRSGVRGAR